MPFCRYFAINTIKISLLILHTIVEQLQLAVKYPLLYIETTALAASLVSQYEIVAINSPLVGLPLASFIVKPNILLMSFKSPRVKQIPTACRIDLSTH